MSDLNKLDTNSEKFEELMHDALKAYEADVEETDEFLATIKGAMGGSKLALEQYGQLLNETLRTKAQVRDRLLKLINMLAQRVRIKEVMDKDKGGLTISPEEMLKLIDQAQSGEDNG